jgi:hypothetical protein
MTLVVGASSPNSRKPTSLCFFGEKNRHPPCSMTAKGKKRPVSKARRPFEESGLTSETTPKGAHPLRFSEDVWAAASYAGMMQTTGPQQLLEARILSV